jgi:secreted PhoX family phosphatase
MKSIIEQLMTRRSMLKGSVALGVASFVGLYLVDKNGAAAQVPTDPVLNFDVVPTSDFDAVVIPPGHSAQVLYAYGDPIAAGLTPFSNGGTEPGLEFDNRFGDHHDGMYFFGIDANGTYDPTANHRGILCLNYENITQVLMHANGPTTDAEGNRTDVDEVRKEQRAHGVACIEVVRDETTGQFSVVQDSPFVNIQHPGESSDLTTDPATFVSNWPNPSRNATDAPVVGARARSATIVITREDGGPIGTA